MKKSGFSLIELAIVIAILGIVALAIVPTMRSPKSVSPKEFVAKLNTLMQAAWQQALMTNNVQKVFFDFTKKKITLQELASSDKSDGKTDEQKKFVPVTATYLTSELAIPAGYNFNNFYIEKKDQMRIAGERTTAWFFLVSEGLAQEVIINGFDRGDAETASSAQTRGVETRSVETRGVERFSFVLNPFSAQFTYYDKFQTP